MKILVCTDGSERNKMALDEAAKIITGCKPDQVTLIHVYQPMAFFWEGESMENILKLDEQQKEKAKGILAEAAKTFEENDIKADTLLKQGHPAETIINVISDQGYDMIILGSKGKGAFLGSVTSPVVQEVRNCTVVVVK